jgi:hypothetical protein
MGDSARSVPLADSGWLFSATTSPPQRIICYSATPVVMILTRKVELGREAVLRSSQASSSQMS